MLITSPFQLHALYAPSLDQAADELLPHRLVQAFDLSEFVRHTSSGSDLTLVMGDINTQAESMCGQVIKSNAGLTDAWEVRGNKDDVSTHMIYPSNELHFLFSTTCNSLASRVAHNVLRHTS